MDIDLKQGLGAIADDAPDAHLDPDTLWSQGVRRRNRRRGGGALVALAAVAAVAAGSLLVPQALDRPEPPVASDERDAALPDRLWSPSPWTASTDDGNPGRIAALFWDNTTRRTAWGGGSQGYVAVSAYDGSYRYLDAPGLVDLQRWSMSEPTLSPDGRFVAYPVDGPGATGQAVAGWRVYDARTGDVHTLTVQDAPHGVSPQSARWSEDSSTLFATVCPVTESSPDSASCRVRGLLAWDPLSGRSQEAPLGRYVDLLGGPADRPLVLDGRRIGELDLGTGDVEELGRVDVPPEGVRSAALSDTGILTVLSPTGDDDDAAGTESAVGLFVAELGSGASGSPAPSRQVGEVAGTYAQPLAVHDRDGVVWVSDKAAGAGNTHRIVRLGEDGSTTDLISVPGDFTGTVPLLAADLALLPPRDFGEPDQPRDPRVAGAIGLAGLGLVGLVVAWRRRRKVTGWARA